MADLTDFGASTEPTVELRRTLTLGDRQVGKLGVDRVNETWCYVSERDTDDHRYHGEDPWYDFPFEGPGYGLSVELFNRIDGSPAGRVYIVETDTGDVHHFGFEQFVDGTPINYEDESDDRGYEKGFQKVVPLSDAVETWRGAYPGLYARQAAFR